jgi:integrase
MSILKKAAEEYLKGRRALGFKLYEHGLFLDQFIAFLEAQEKSVITKEFAVKWATLSKGCNPSRWTKKYGVIRQFALYYRAIDPRTEILPEGLFPYTYKRKQPYIYKKKQIIELINAAKGLESSKGLRALTVSTFIGLLAVTGMRIGECLGLDCEDVNLKEGLLTIRKTKNGKPRLLPLHISTVKVLRNYAKKRDAILPISKSPRFFVNELGTKLTQWSVRQTFVRLSHQIGLRRPSDRFGPRIHDLRHTVAVRILQEWYRKGKDVEAYLPHLTTFLGHGHLDDTYWYITGVPELMQLAVKKMYSLKGDRTL